MARGEIIIVMRFWQNELMISIYTEKFNKNKYARLIKLAQ
jgi:hypothetical protein